MTETSNNRFKPLTRANSLPKSTKLNEYKGFSRLKRAVYITECNLKPILHYNDATTNFYAMCRSQPDNPFLDDYKKTIITPLAKARERAINDLEKKLAAPNQRKLDISELSEKGLENFIRISGNSPKIYPPFRENPQAQEYFSEIIFPQNTTDLERARLRGIYMAPKHLNMATESQLFSNSTKTPPMEQKHSHTAAVTNRLNNPHFPRCI